MDGEDPVRQEGGWDRPWGGEQSDLTVGEESVYQEGGRTDPGGGEQSDLAVGEDPVYQGGGRTNPAVGRSRSVRKAGGRIDSVVGEESVRQGDRRIEDRIDGPDGDGGRTDRPVVGGEICPSGIRKDRPGRGELYTL